MFKILKQLFRIDKKRISFLFLMMFIAGFLDMISIGFLIPLLNSLFDSSIEVPIITKLFSNLSLRMEKTQIVSVSLVLIMITFLIKNLFILLYTKINTNFLVYLTVKYQQIIYQKYISQPFTEISKKTTSEYLRNILQEARLLSVEFLSPALNLLLNFITLILFGTLLLFVNFKITITLFIISFVLFLFFSKIFQKKINKFGEQRQKFNLKATEFVKQSFDGIKELKINNKENYFVEKLKLYLSRFANMGVSRSIITVLPKISLEILMIFLFTSTILISIKMNLNYQDLIFILPIYAAAAFRILPNLNSMIKCYQRMNFSKSAFILFEDLITHNSNNLQKENETNPIYENLEFNKYINLKDISFSYGKKLIFENLNLNIKKNISLGIKGDSGVGKSTFIDLLCGLNKPNKGQVFVDDINISNKSNAWMKNIGYVQQDSFIFDDSLKNNITLENDINKVDQKLLKECIEISLLQNLVESFPKGVDENLGEFGAKLSGGQKQRISIARALYKKPKVLIFDESFNNLEIEKVDKILQIIFNLKNKMTIIIISHNKRSFKYCDKVYNISNKNIKEVKL